jgi:hypothetical protein
MDAEMAGDDVEGSRGAVEVPYAAVCRPIRVAPSRYCAMLAAGFGKPSKPWTSRVIQEMGRRA